MASLEDTAGTGEAEAGNLSDEVPFVSEQCIFCVFGRRAADSLVGP